MIRPSPNELDRLRQEEFVKRRIIRLKEVRQYSKVNSGKLRELYKMQKAKVINRVAQTIQEQINAEDEDKLKHLKQKYECQISAVGEAHQKASNWIDPSIVAAERDVTNRQIALEREIMAIQDLREAKQEADQLKTNRLRNMQKSMEIERERAAAIAALPAINSDVQDLESFLKTDDSTPRVKVCDKSKYSVVESYTTGSYNVLRENISLIDESNLGNAIEAGKIRQIQIDKLAIDHKIQSEEQDIKAHLRGHQAIKKQLVQKDYEQLLTDLDHIAKSEMVKRQKDYHKNEMVDPSSAGYTGTGHNVSMMMFKEKCRERAIEAAVLESLKDISNKPNVLMERNEVVESTPERLPSSNTQLTNLYERIRQQKENVYSVKNSELVNEDSDADIRIDNQIPYENIQDDKCSPQFPKIPSTGAALIFQKALVNASKSGAVLEVTNIERERLKLEDDIRNIDKKIDIIMEKEPCHIESNVRRISKDSEAEKTDQLSVYSEMSDNMKRVREFQHAALMKLSGRMNLSQIMNLERQFSELSMDSNSVIETSCINTSETQQMDTEGRIKSPNSFSSINDWVTDQLCRSIETLPQWVTKQNNTVQRLPNINVPLTTNSKLILRSNTPSSASTLFDDSIDKLDNHTAFCQAQSSLTNVSNFRNITSCYSDEWDKNTTLLVHDKLEQSSCSSSTFSQRNQINYSISTDSLMETNKNTLKINNIDGRIAEQNENTFQREPDLIDFTSVDDVRSMQKDNITERDVTVKLTDHPKTLLNGEIVSNDYFRFDEQSNNNLKSSAELIEKNVEVPPSVEVNNCDNESDTEKNLINNYESFLSNLIATNFLPGKRLKTVEEDLTNIETELSETDDNISYENERSVGQSFGISNDKSSYSVHDSFTKKLNIDPIQSHHETIRHLSQMTTQNVFGKGVIDIEFPEKECIVISDEISVQPNEMEHVTKLMNENESLSFPPNEISLVDSVNSGGKCKEFCHADVDNSEIEGSFKTLPEYRSVNTMNAENTCRSDLNKAKIDEESNSFSLHSLPECDSTVMNQEVTNKQIPLNQNAKTLLSSTLLPGKKIDHCRLFVNSPISSISSESSSQAKYRIMMEYFEKNKAYLAGLSSSSKSAFKDLTSSTQSTARNDVDSGMATSRFTSENNSGQNTSRLTTENIFVTPRDDSYLTDYTPRNDISDNNEIMQPLPEYDSDDNGKWQVGRKDDFGSVNDVCNPTEEQYHNLIADNRIENSPNLLLFDSESDLQRTAIFMQDASNNDVVKNHKESENLDDKDAMSNLSLDFKQHSSYATNKFILDSDVPSMCSTTDSNVSSLKKLDTYHSSEDFFFNNLPEGGNFSCDQSEHYLEKATGDSKSEADISNQSLASFVRNEMCCRQMEVESNKQVSVESSSTPNERDAIQLMKNQLAQWKSERLRRINQNPPKGLQTSYATKESKNRKQDSNDNRSRTVKLWNNLEEVVQLKKNKEVGKLRKENLQKRKEYAENIRRHSKDKQAKNQK